jgi:RimJ/RimL family protein N-acetyltransferase
MKHPLKDNSGAPAPEFREPHAVMVVTPVVLEGEYVRLEPLELEHHAALCEVALDDDLWRWAPTQLETPADVMEYIETALAWQEAGTAVPFVIVEKSSKTVVGSTRFANIDRSHRHLEIGWTWVARPWQRTAVNTECKYLLLRHAFEQLGCIRVEFKTDALNLRSRAAIARIGATEEGMFRNHMITSSGRIRHSVWFSIIDSEWTQVKKGLEAKLHRTAKKT